MFGFFQRQSDELRLEWHRHAMVEPCMGVYDACWKVFPRDMMPTIEVDASSVEGGVAASLNGVTVTVPWENGPGKWGIDFRLTAQKLFDAFIDAGLAP